MTVSFVCHSGERTVQNVLYYLSRMRRKSEIIRHEEALQKMPILYLTSLGYVLNMLMIGIVFNYIFEFIVFVLRHENPLFLSFVSCI